MSKLPKIIWSKIDQVPEIGMYLMLVIANAFSQSTYVQFEESDISHKE